MSSLIGSLATIVVWVAVAPLLPGIINRIKAWVAGRRGPPVFQLYFDLVRLCRKGVVVGEHVSPGFLAGPVIAWVTLVVAALILPIGPLGNEIGFRGDFVVLVYLLALGRFGLTWAAMETGSAFEGMGTVREVSYAVLSEAAVITALMALCVQGGTVSLGTMLAPGGGGAVSVLLAAGLFIVLLAENCRVPFDDPNTHLELTMVHEVMVLDHSGPPLALILHGASMKLLLYSILLVEAVLPVARMPLMTGLPVLALGVLAVVAGIGFVESFLARAAFRRVPLLLVMAFLFCLFALLATWRQGSIGGNL